jgi:hypothetical protein
MEKLQTGNSNISLVQLPHFYFEKLSRLVLIDLLSSWYTVTYIKVTFENYSSVYEKQAFHKCQHIKLYIHYLQT